MRAFITGITYASLFFGLPIITVLGAVALSARWRAWEVLILALLVDMLYTSVSGVFGIPFVTTLAALVVVWGLEPLRARLYE